ncbi:hypothetical protein [Emcibacter nanhaiensis]|uniref:PepSY domain-containing protein n=1 Tax=Emcibacter nanhaiensis TaxID=1505037 RepID=A0A501PSP8_9PROT|nr:hypothetical protein [Emcibacter nanhaiensis]TPD62984.1 hypothetical protein FIV46_02585 [Emcibacter nanhaiensis]
MNHTVKIATLASIIALAGAFSAPAFADSIGDNNGVRSVEHASVDKSEAKSLVKEFLKENGHSSLRPGDAQKISALVGIDEESNEKIYRDKWKVDVRSLNRAQVGTLYVDTETGEITTKR